METEITMAKTDFRSVDEYIASQPKAVQGLLKRVRSTIRRAAPGTEEMISFGSNANPAVQTAKHAKPRIPSNLQKLL